MATDIEYPKKDWTKPFRATMQCHGSRKVAYCAVLTASFGERLVTIGNFPAQGVVGYRGFERTLASQRVRWPSFWVG
jgi:hypothetical protein